MRWGSLVSIVSVAAVLVAFALQILYPHEQLYIFYIVLVWVIAGFFVYRLPFMSRTVGGPKRLGGTPPTASVSDHPIPGMGPPPGTSAGALGFCMYCGSLVDPGTAMCPSCGRSLPLA